MRSIKKFYPLGQGKKAGGKYIGQQDVRRYRPPLGYSSATAELIYNHPLMQERFASSEWWIF